ncbi:DUF5693 family protein [Alkalihalophilus marmarensis]|uniref:Uncharacterized protein n=1 Tax=Alkalihalophilus marmarensis DSM 21297 TaxID=1188261 RepID=U6SMZ9_9BACI|nr:DUF5693 family protein [Alkalihalophilus marmarensis]ERN52001.1 hypothetical protein A33I_18075 [Alkalihalophilus marmarensis DSM 21297]
MVKKIAWALIVIALLVSIPSIIDRVNVEQSNKSYEITMAYDQYEQWPLMLDEMMTEEEILEQLIDSGVGSMSFEPLTIWDLVLEGLFERKTRPEIIHEHPEARDELPEHNGQYIRILDDETPYIDMIKEAYNNHYQLMYEDEIFLTRYEVEEYEYGEDRILFFPYEVSLAAMPITFDFDAIDIVHEAGMDIIPRLPNSFPTIQYENHFIYKQMERLAVEYQADKVLFSGNDVVGSGEPEQLRTFTSALNEFNYDIITIDFNDQRGMDSLLRLGNKEDDVIRLFSMQLGKGNEAKFMEEVEKGIRGYKERNIRILFVNPLVRFSPTSLQTYHHPGEAQQGFNYTLEMVDTFTERLGDGHEGGASPYASLSQSTIVTLFVTLGAAALITLTAYQVWPILAWPAALGGLALMAAGVVLNIDIALKALALLTAIAAAAYAGLHFRTIRNWKHLLATYAISAGIALIGAWLVVGMLYGTEFLVKVDEFRGVKVLSAAPAAIVGLLLFYTFIRKTLNEPVRYWHLMVIGIVGAILAFYVTRTGNAATALPYELEFRQWLENLLYVRPRTTEFLIGFPLFILGLYMMMVKNKLAPIFITIGMLGFASIVGTFTHLHTPLLVSGLRSVYGLLFGLGFGLLYIYIYRVITVYVYPRVEKRWMNR